MQVSRMLFLENSWVEVTLVKPFANSEPKKKCNKSSDVEGSVKRGLAGNNLAIQSGRAGGEKPVPPKDYLVSMRGAAPDTMSLHSLRRPLVSQRPTAVMASSSGLGPLSQWQLTGENYIDSEQRKRHRGLLASRRNEDHFVGSPTKENRRLMYSCGPLGGTWETTHSGHTSPDSPGSVGSSSPNSLASSSSMADVEKPLRKPREERSTVFDRTVRIPRKKLVLDGPLYATSYAHWNSQVFPPPPANMANGSSD
ncbi:hypothetical protein BIW11_11983 [Tropilaelaps mercedesae]|uniref:Uncharacterized protein n=1 Tax=Tropilaelaps mercedesae TaxID=418985 RepID=A0A1V9X8L6_9ACAR|nr:hypothetical protein BIW11_11983 [Tropilaelaps mercedesae]